MLQSSIQLLNITKKKEHSDEETIQPKSSNNETHICTRAIHTYKRLLQWQRKMDSRTHSCRSGNVIYDVDIVHSLGSTCKPITILSPSRDQIELHLTARYLTGHFQIASTMFPRYTKG